MADSDCSGLRPPVQITSGTALLEGDGGPSVSRRLIRIDNTKNSNNIITHNSMGLAAGSALILPRGHC